MAAVVVTTWLVTVGCPPGMAQDMLAFRPIAAGDLAHQPLIAPDEEFTDVTTWETPETQSADGAWTQRIARLVRGRTQLEGGYSYLRGSVGGSNWAQHTLPDMLLRFGLTDRLELRLGWPGYVSSNSDDPVSSGGHTGTLDPNVGLLYDLWQQRDLLPRAAVLVAIPVPLEGNPFALNSLQPLTELMYSWETSDRTAVTGRSGFAIFETAGDNYTQFQQGVSFDVILTQRLGAFVSWDMLVNQRSWSDTSQHMAGGGLSFALTDRFAICWRSAAGLNSAAPDFLNDIRLVYRF